jgi:hypothetical protein
MRAWSVKTDRERSETAGDSARRMRLWIARLFLRSAKAISTEVVDDLIASRGEEEYPPARSPFEPPGPPPHWLARVREGAPELLLSPEQGGTPANSFAAFHPPDFNAEMYFTSPPRLNPDASRAPESPAPPAPQPRRFTPTPGDSPTQLHNAKPSPAAKRSLDTGAYVRSPSVAPIKPLSPGNVPLSAPTNAPHASSRPLEIHAPPVRRVANEMQAPSTHPSVVNREQTSAMKGPPSRESAASLASRQSTPANPSPVNLRRRVQQLWWGPRKVTSDPAPPSPASATYPIASFDQRRKEAHGNQPTAGEYEAAVTPSQVPVNIDQWKYSVSPPHQRHVTLSRPANLQSFDSNNAAKAQSSSAEASSVIFTHDDNFNRWPELLEAQSADGDVWSQALSESDHLNVLNREQRGGH